MTGSDDAGTTDTRLVVTIRSGDVVQLRAILAAKPERANATLAAGSSGVRTPLQVVTDWPGYYPHGAEVVRILVAAGADPNVTIGDPPSETPLHWAASTDDVEVAEALIDGGAELETPGASIAGGPPLDNAVGYGCWHVARLLVRRGARLDRLWHAAALGDLTRLEQLTAGDPPPTQTQLDEAFWQACHGGQRRAAEYLLGLGADINGTPGYSDCSPLEIAGSTDTRSDLLTDWLRQRGARSRPDAPA
jgi:ankyrin repeat protein